ncbi:MAG TPA: VOC family protein [Blastocatellia bacterium]|nr:VOC family protein [Blastocatellia bacterium]
MGRPVMRWQILAKDPENAAEFYTTLFDWTVNSDNPLGYRMVDTGSDRGIQGGIWPSPPEGHSLVQLYVEVDDVAASVEKATTLGASVIVPLQKLPDGDEMAIVLDPEGIPFGVFKPAGK